MEHLAQAALAHVSVFLRLGAPYLVNFHTPQNPVIYFASLRFISSPSSWKQHHMRRYTLHNQPRFAFSFFFFSRPRLCFFLPGSLC